MRITGLIRDKRLAREKRGALMDAPTMPEIPVRAREIPLPDKHHAAVMAASQNDALLALLRGLDEADWRRRTDCAEWCVREIVAHLVGAMKENIRLRTMLRHAVVARRRFPERRLLDGVNAAQVADHEGWSGQRLARELARLGPRAVRARRRTPGFVRRIRPPSGFRLPPDVRFGEILDVVLVRDTWMHRIDIARACGRETPPARSDSGVVSLVIRDLDRYWSGPPMVLELTGACGGRWRIGAGEPVAVVRADAVECCRSLSGRGDELACEVSGDPAAAEALRAARVLF
jgi:uncharacterized protein (TIGR03083 family)